MKTHVEDKKPVPSRTYATPAPSSLAHYEQYRQAMRRAGVQPRLETGVAQAKHEHTPSNIPIFKVDFGGNMQLLNLQNRTEDTLRPYVWIPINITVSEANSGEQETENSDKSEAEQGVGARLLENKTVQFLVGLPTGALAGAAPGGFLVGLVGEASFFKQLPTHFRMGYGLGETLVGIYQLVVGLNGLAEGGALTGLGGITSPTGVGALVGVGGVGISAASGAMVVQGGANVGVGAAVFMEAWNGSKANTPAGQVAPEKAGGAEHKLTEPSRKPNLNAKPDGEPTQIGPNAKKRQRKTLEAENEAAQIFAKNGYHIKQQPKVLPRDGIKPGKNPDYRIEGEIFDCYTPVNSNTRVQIIRERIRSKVAHGQTQRAVINLQKFRWKGSVNELGKQFKVRKIHDLKEVFIIDVDGSILRVFP